MLILVFPSELNMIRLTISKGTKISAGEKAKGPVPQPNVLKNYSSFMEGVVNHGWWISEYSVSIRSK